MDAPKPNELARQRIQDRFQNDPEVKGTTFELMVAEYFAAEDEFNALDARIQNFKSEAEEYNNRRKQFIPFRDTKEYGKALTKGEFHEPDIKIYPKVPKLQHY